MQFSTALVRSLMLVLAFALVPLAMPATISAETTTIYADAGQMLMPIRCSSNLACPLRPPPISRRV